MQYSVLVFTRIAPTRPASVSLSSSISSVPSPRLTSVSRRLPTIAASGASLRHPPWSVPFRLSTQNYGRRYRPLRLHRRRRPSVSACQSRTSVHCREEWSIGNSLGSERCTGSQSVFTPSPTGSSRPRDDPRTVEDLALAYRQRPTAGAVLHVSRRPHRCPTGKNTASIDRESNRCRLPTFFARRIRPSRRYLFSGIVGRVDPTDDGSHIGPRSSDRRFRSQIRQIRSE